MKVIDNTPYRSEGTGEIDLFGRIQGMLKFGMTWYDRVKAQDVVIAAIEKQLGNGYTLLHNVTLPNTEITLPLVLLGPPGVFLINALHEQGVFMARDDEWGTMVGDRFMPARINQISRTLTFGRVLQVYLERQGYKGVVAVDSIMMAANSGMHVESTRPAVRIVMSDALERFAASMNQSRSTLDAQTASDLVQAILTGRARKQAMSEPPASSAPQQGQADGSPFETYDPQSAQQEDASSSDPLAFSFNEEQSGEEQSGAATPFTQEQDASPATPSQQRTAKRPAAKGRRRGLTTNQMLILAGMALCWVCLILGAFVYIYFTQ